jgi:FkbM family methyltransferase
MRSIIYFLIRFLPTGFVLPIVSGPLKGRKWIVGAAAGDGKGLSILINKSEPDQVKWAVKYLSKGNVCFDIGANVGFYTLLFSQYTKHVYAFEPLARNLRYLIKLTEINRLANVSILPCAMSDRVGIGYFTEGVNHAEGKVDKNGRIPVLLTTCDQFIVESKITPDLLKIDVEGAELGVLQGAKNLLESSHPVILLSVHSDQLRTDCLAYLSDRGYKQFIPLNAEQFEKASEFAIYQ